MEMEDTWERAYISKTTFTITVLAIQVTIDLLIDVVIPLSTDYISCLEKIIKI